MKKRLSPAKKALLQQWLQGNKGVASENTIVPRAPGGKLNLSLPQQRHLFHEIVNPGTAVNNLSVFLRLEGDLDHDALVRSANQILARHEVLKTRFTFDFETPVPELIQKASIEIPVTHLGDISPERVKEKVRMLAEVEVSKPFNLTQAPLVKLLLYKISEKLHFLLIIIHHAIADGWSLGVFLSELMQFYKSNHLGLDIQLPTLSIQYFDYAYWQNLEETRTRMLSSLSYWRVQLGGEIPLLELPIDGSRDQKQSFKGDCFRFEISEKQIDGLRQMRQQEDATLYMILLSLFGILLHRYSGQDDILIGTPTANRNLPELTNLIGVFINTLVIRVDHSGNPTFRELLARVRKTSLEAYSHQDLPFERLVEEIKPSRTLNRPPLFQVVFNLQNAPLPELKLEGLKSEFIDIDRKVAPLDLTLMITKDGESLGCVVEYNDDLFEGETISRMFATYQRYLDLAIDNPDSRISEFLLLTSEERNDLMKLNDTARSFSLRKGVQELFEDQVKKSPDRIAVECGDKKVTYSELNLYSNLLAEILVDKGVKNGTRVGVFLERSLDTIVSLLSIFKLGGIYIPIHIDSPVDRIKYMIHDADVHTLLTNVTVDPTEFESVVFIDPKLYDNQHTSQSFSYLTEPESLAYIIYTSGSTGRPKGVMIKHLSLLNFLWSMLYNPGINEQTVMLAHTTISFDPSTLEIFGPLMAGGRIVIPAESEARDPNRLAELINDKGVNFIQATPATWRLLLATGWEGNKDVVAFCGGDMLPVALASDILNKVGVLWNVYGPTETTVWASLSKVGNDQVPITIGQPIANMEIYILDQYLQPVPAGVVGEIHIAGPGLASAYLNKTKLTQERFISVFMGESGVVSMYKTGDLARYLPDYQIQMLGRKDDQVKINGNRVELGEVTSVLLEHPEIRDGVVLNKRDKDGTDKLVAYCVSNHQEGQPLESIREFMVKKLPAYMVPSFFIPIDALPLTKNGKIDRKLLPDTHESEIESDFVPPSNEDERVMADIWQNVLDVPQVGINDNFFDLGGASIQSIQVVAQANMLGYKISVENIFEYQTIEELVAFTKSVS